MLRLFSGERVFTVKISLRKQSKWADPRGTSKLQGDGHFPGNQGERDEKRKMWFEIVLYQVTRGHVM